MKERIDFIFIEGIEPRINSYSVFIGYLFPVTASILQKGYTFKIISLRLLKDYSIRGLVNELARFEFKAVCMTTTADSIRYVYCICNEVKKEFPKVPIILGGPQASYDDVNVMNKCMCDFIVRNEGDYKNIEIIEQYYGRKEFSAIAGITWRKDNKIITNEASKPLDINKLPTPNYKILADAKYWVCPIGVSEESFKDKLSKIRQTYRFFMTGRGCPNKCAFCVEGNAGNVFRYRSVEKLREDLISFIKNTGHKYIAIADDTFTSSVKRVKSICEMFKEVQQDYPFTWYCEGRVDVLSKYPEILDIMVDAGLVSLQIGVESGNQEVLDIYNKRITVEQIKNVIYQARKYPSLRIFGNIILGNPHETIDQLHKSLTVISELVKLSGFKFEITTSVLTPFVGTPIRIQSEKFGIELFYPDFEERRFSFSDIVCKPNTLSIPEMYSVKSIAETHFQQLACEKLFLCDDVKQRVLNLLNQEESDSMNIWLSRSKIGSSSIFSKYLKMLTKRMAVLDCRKYDYQEKGEMFPVALWELEYSEETDSYYFFSLNDISYTLSGVKAYLWDSATGEKTLNHIYEECKLLFPNTDYSQVVSFYDEMDTQLALLYMKL